MNNSDPSGMWTVIGQINQTFTPSGAESWLASLYPNGVSQVTFKVGDKRRRIDVYNRSNGGWLNEIKTGSYSNNSKTQTQYERMQR